MPRTGEHLAPHQYTTQIAPAMGDSPLTVRLPAEVDRAFRAKGKDRSFWLRYGLIKLTLAEGWEEPAKMQLKPYKVQLEGPGGPVVSRQLAPNRTAAIAQAEQEYPGATTAQAELDI